METSTLSTTTPSLVILYITCTVASMKVEHEGFKPTRLTRLKADDGATRLAMGSAVPVQGSPLAAQACPCSPAALCSSLPAGVARDAQPGRPRVLAFHVGHAVDNGSDNEWLHRAAGLPRVLLDSVSVSKQQAGEQVTVTAGEQVTVTRASKTDDGGASLPHLPGKQVGCWWYHDNEPHDG